MFLFILESIGTSELLLIAVVALIMFGPRKLPQIARTIGKTMAEFRNATNEFKETWEREAAFEIQEKNTEKGFSFTENTIGRNSGSQAVDENAFPKPQVKELPREIIEQNFQDKKSSIETIKPPQGNIQEQAGGKRDWL